MQDNYSIEKNFRSIHTALIHGRLRRDKIDLFSLFVERDEWDMRFLS